MSVELRLGDCLELMREIPSQSIDCVITDPPYGMNWNTDSTRFTGGRRDIHRGAGRNDWGSIVQDKEPFDPSPFLNFPKVILWGSNHFANRLPVGTTLIWLKKPDYLFQTFLSDAELAWMKGGHGVYCFSKQFPPPARMAEGLDGKVAHPTQKPIELMAWCLDMAKVTAGQTVFDPFMGSGSLAIACIRRGINYIGFEINPTYFAIAQRRIAEAQMQLTLPLTDEKPEIKL